MSRIFTVMFALVACLAFASGCKDDAKTGTGGGTPTTGAAGGGAAAAASGPTKETAVKALRDAAAALEAKDYDKAVTYFHVPPNATADQFKAAAPQMVSNREISKQGVDILAAQGKWGKLEEVYGKDKAQRYAERSGVALDECYGLNHGDAETGFHWNGQQFKLIRCDDVGKLTQ